jgi:endo-1,4-beta-xylanase
VIEMGGVVNEAVIMPIFDPYDNGITRICQELGRIELLRTVFETARATKTAAQRAAPQKAAATRTAKKAR